MRIGREVSCRAGHAEERAHDFPVFVPLADNLHIVERQPGVERSRRHVGREGTGKDAGIGGQPQETEQNDPGEANRVLVVHGPV